MIKVSNVYMKYTMDYNNATSLKEFFFNLFKKNKIEKKKNKDFMVLKDIDFNVEKGEVIGIIGKNGAGKSTLLKLIAGILTPASGSISCDGKIVPMLELGSGFDYDLSGRENIYLNGSILGYSKVFLESKYEEILAFSELGDFIDVPIRNYSSGMLMRLAFSIATVVNPEILIVDEILSVGDESFQRKSKERMLELMGGGTTVLFVSHSVDQIKTFCSRVIWLEDGKVKMIGDSRSVCNKYSNIEEVDEEITKKIIDSPYSPNYKDVLFINGCSSEYSKRYRVWNQIEQLHFNNMSCDCIHYEDLRHKHISYYRTFIFFKCRHTKEIESFIKKAKEYNKVIFFDTDEILIDEKNIINNSNKELNSYLEESTQIKKTLSLCDYAITTTKTLQLQLKDYCNGEVFINKNVVSEEMAKYSLEATETSKNKELTMHQEAYFKNTEGKFIIGYFDGSIENNENFGLIKEVILKILKKYKHVNLLTMGTINIPSEFQVYKNQIISVPCLEWNIVPQIMAMININVIPLIDSVFNSAKPENIWNESSLVKTATIASKIGNYGEIIDHEYNGLLALNNVEWLDLLEKCIEEKINYTEIAENAFSQCSQNNVSSCSGENLADFIVSKLKRNVLFILPSCKISGEVNVILKHAQVLKNNGADVLILSMNNDNIHEMIVNNISIPIISTYHTSLHSNFDIAIATLWTTCQMVMSYPKIKKRMYMVQNFETNFYEFGNFNKMLANITYTYKDTIQYATISKWCENWLREKFQIQSKYVKNGFDSNLFKFKERDFSGKIRVLIEGNSNDFYKNVDESFIITNELNKDKYEIWYLSYEGQPKDWYKVDKIFNKVPYEKVGEIYRKCHILLKTSTLESFSYPHLEMMSTGGISIVRENHGNVEYLENNYNCLMYDKFDLGLVLELFNNIQTDEVLRHKLIKNGKVTVDQRKWENIEKDIVELYLN